MLPAYALVTLAELKSYFVLTGTARDAELERAIDRASRDVEEYLDRRLIYRAPTEDDDQVVASALIATGALAVAGQPTGGRTLVVTKTDADHSLTAGILTVTGTVGGVAGTTETFDLTVGDVLHGVKFFTAVSAAALAGVAGATGSDFVKVGVSQGYTEYFSPCGSEVMPIEWPIQGVAEVNEDLNLTYAAATALTTSDYAVRQPFSVRRRIARISNLLDFPFYTGRRVVRVRYSAGYKAGATIPTPIKGVCLELASWHYQYADKKDFGLQSHSDAMGSISRTGPPMITKGMSERLTPYIRAEFDRNAERDFDLEAA